MNTDIDFNNPEERLRLIERVGIVAYNSAVLAYIEANPIRPMATRFGLLYAVGQTGKAFSSREEAEAFLKDLA